MKLISSAQVNDGLCIEKILDIRLKSLDIRLVNRRKMKRALLNLTHTI